MLKPTLISEEPPIFPIIPFDILQLCFICCLPVKIIQEKNSGCSNFFTRPKLNNTVGQCCFSNDSAMKVNKYETNQIWRNIYLELLGLWNLPRKCCSAKDGSDTSQCEVFRLTPVTFLLFEQFFELFFGTRDGSDTSEVFRLTPVTAQSPTSQPLPPYSDTVLNPTLILYWGHCTVCTDKYWGHCTLNVLTGGTVFYVLKKNTFQPLPLYWQTNKK